MNFDCQCDGRSGRTAGISHVDPAKFGIVMPAVNVLAGQVADRRANQNVGRKVLLSQ